MADEEPDYSSLPLTERFVHKVWKVRKQAYEDAARQFEATPDEADPAFRPFLQEPGLWKGAVADSNVAAQQDGINALCVFLKFGGPQACTRTRNHTVAPLVEKGLSSTRAATKSSALEALLLYIELDVPGPIVDDLLPPLSHKQPKIIAATLAALTAIYHAYGCRTADPKPVLKTLPKIFGHADKNVRAEAQNLVVELYRWLREAMKPTFWNDLKPVQQTDLDALFEKVKQDPMPKQERLLRSQQAVAAAAVSSGPAGDAAGEEADEAEEEAEVEAIDIFEPVDVMPKVPKDLHENLASTKWKDRKDGLDGLYAAVNVPRIKDGDFAEIVRALAKCMKDANIAVVTVAANCVEVLAKGLRKGFSKYRSTVMAPMMERLKEKKQSVADALGAALDAVCASTSLSDCLEETLGFLKHKNPQVKVESVRFLIRSLRTTRDVPSKAEVKLICDTVTSLLTESSEVLRAAAAEVLGTLMKILGERAMNPYLDGLDEIRKTKIKEYCESAQVKAKDKPKPPPAAAPARVFASGPSKKVVGKKPGPAVKKAAPSPAPILDDTPLKPRPTARAPVSKLVGPPKSGLAAPSGGLKLQRKLAGPGASTPGISTPKRPVSQVSLPDEDAAPAPPKLGLGGRGLAGRPLGKPALPASACETAVPTAGASNLSVLERAELEESRAEKERLQRANEELRTERSRLHSQIHELQNQNAQLIEDHTRDVLSIKAKETQLVRARSDAEAAEQMCQKQQREMERLKRELSRAVRATSPAPADVSEQIYRDAGANAAHGYAPSSGRPGASSISSTSRPAAFSSLGEEKENGDPDAPHPRRSKMASPPPSFSRPVSGIMGGRGSPTVSGRGDSRESRGRRDSRDGGSGSAGGEAANGGAGIESWKRAAEVTSQLKARIEQMKARQGIARP
ncbi:MAG: Microtubule-associated protein, microtubule dynamics during spindle orientation [Thelocarpon superellum]|nr:MAG: Microtubule-associated protein, microtubule dynamics during spindle orientation [Thelocarpon superellum]